MIVLFSDLQTFFNKIPLGNKRRVAFITNARDTYEDNTSLTVYKRFLENFNLLVEFIDLRNFSYDALFSKLSSFEVIYVTGGNSFYLLDVIKKSGFDKLLPSLLEKGIMYLGESAGAIVLGPTIEPTKHIDFPEYSNLTDYSGLGFYDFIFLPHSDVEKYIPKIKLVEETYSKDFVLKKFSNSQGLIIDDKGHFQFID